MPTLEKHPMQMTRIRATVGALATLLLTACGSLEVGNPNAPDALRALSDPAAIEAVAGGTMRSWFNTYEGCEGNCVLVTQAQSFSASWNNWNMNFYSSIDADGKRLTRPFQNDAAAAGRTTMEVPWVGMYSAVSSAVDALKAIRVQNVVINNVADTKRAEAVAELMLGASLSYIALNFDKGYIVDETTDLATLQYSNRKEIRDAAIAKLQSAATIAGANTFSTLPAWTNGVTYTSTQIRQIANTLSAMTLANYPRNASEVAAVAWPTVVTYAAAGMSSGTRFDFVFVGDGCVSFCHQILTWFDDFSTGRVHTRVANLLDPATQATPWPLAGNPVPNSPDKRLGDGSFGDATIVAGFGTNPKTANAGTDFAYSRDAIFRPSRGSYHQSNIGFVRYDLTGLQDPSGIWAGFGPAPVITATQNDLIWAEALIRTGALATAVPLINRTRVTRGGLSAAAVGDGVAGLLAKLSYENEIELLGLGAGPYYWIRRGGTMLEGTPREMPVPAKELGVKGEANYTWGGSGAANSPPP
jgi:starch-binding outer membrane protein, SusD/RagB family